MKLLKQSTASTVVVGPVLDTNGAAVTTAVVGDFRLAKNGTTATLSGATVTHDANGYYTVALTTGNTDTVGGLAIYSGNTAQSMATHSWTVLLATVFDAIVTNATNTTGGLATATGAISAFAGAISTYAGGAVASVTAGVTVSTNNDKTGYSLTAGTGLGNQTADITGNLSGSVGSVTAGVTVTTNSDKTDYALSSTSRDAIVTDFLAHVITKGSAGTIERAFWQAAKTQASAQGEVSGTPTATAFDTDLAAVTGAFDDLLLLFVSGSLTGEARPIATYSNTDGRITLQESLTAAPSAADEFLIIPSHTHPIADIQSGLATSAALATVDGLVDLLVSRSGYQMSILAGAISNAQDAAEAYSITLDGSTYSVTYSGLDASGNRSGATLVTT